MLLEERAQAAFESPAKGCREMGAAVDFDEFEMGHVRLEVFREVQEPVARADKTDRGDLVPFEFGPRHRELDVGLLERLDGVLVDQLVTDPAPYPVEECLCVL